MIKLRLCAGAGNGFLSTTIYTVEVTSKELRGSFSVFEGVTRSLGMIVIYTMGAFISWNKIAYVGIIFPIIALIILILYSQESPVYLVSKGEIEKAEKSLRKLNPSGEVFKEIENINEGLKKTKNCSLVISESKWQILKKIYKYPNIYKPFYIVCLLRLVFHKSFKL